MEEKNQFSLLTMGITVAAFMLLLLGILLLPSKPFFIAQATQNASSHIQTVRTAQIKYQNTYSYQRYFIGQLEAQQSALLGFEIGGTLDSLSFEEGAEVKAKEVLATIDTARLEASKKEAEANLAVAIANAKLAATTYKRIFTAQRANAFTEQEKDEAKETRDVTDAAVKVARAQLERILVDINKARLIAPFDGVLVRRLVDLGRVVLTGEPIFEIQQLAEFEVRVGVTPEVADRLVVGENQSVLIAGQQYQSEIKAILPMRGQTRSIDVILTLKTTKSAFRAGDIARLPIDYKITKSGFWVPLSALAEGARGLWSLYVIDEPSNVASRRIVSIEYANATKAFVFGAVEDQEHIVIEGANKLVPGQQVRTVNVAQNEK